MISNKILFLFILIPLITSDSQCDESHQYCAYTCVESVGQCPSSMYCESPYKLVNPYICSYNEDDIIPSTCEKNLGCWEGTCVSNLTEKATKCPSMIACPTSLSVRCSDDRCVENLEECPNYIRCPSFIPIRCPNGECRKSLNDCPSIPTCPHEFSVRCNDGSCHRTINECLIASEGTSCDESMVRCSDGTCSSSKFLCPSQVTCPKNTTLCYDGNCRNKCESPSSMYVSTCTNPNDILCSFDYSCRKSRDFCPTGIICPVNRPVKCWDMSCKETVDQCPEFQSCPKPMKDCPDGSCSMKDTCGTHITCSMDAPFRCYDNTCRKNPDDCPEMPNCPSDAPILCWDGRCLSKRADCLPPNLCDSSNPVKCPDNMCAKSIDSCKEISDCPAQFIKCFDGTCRKKLAYCPEQECPLSFPYKCKNGMCVSNKDHCEKENGCPYNKPNKCKNGECVSGSCDDSIKVNCPSGTRLCPDGSCLPLTKTCPKENGCPVDAPFKCADNTCIDLNKGECSIPICPNEKPIRCNDGLCVESKSNCHSNNYYSLNLKPLCANGIEVDYFEECKLVLPCQEEEIRCDDGSCQENESYCPKINTCPPNLPIRCKDGTCAPSKNECLNSIGCPSIKPYKCSDSGLCIEDPDLCESYDENFDRRNGCDNERPYKCAGIGKCVAISSDCEIDNGCPIDSKIQCENGKCVSSMRKCRTEGKDCIKEKPYQCLYIESTAKCGERPESCFNSYNCKLSEPFRCANGECKRYPYIPGGDSLYSCDISIVCPDYKPFLCADGSCVEKTTFCKSINSCIDESNQFICFDRTCQQSMSGCNNHKKCPAKNPILCQNGNCVSTIFDCIENICPSSKPYKCIHGKCSSSPRDCVQQSDTNSSIIYKTYCEENEVTCYDGTCRLKMEDCPIYPGCPTSELPFKCKDGSCVQNNTQCPNDNEIICEENMTLSVDGICRKEKIFYNGCPNDSPLLCSTGHCVKNLAECVGESSCPTIEAPFRCIDGSCVPLISDCKSSKRNFGVSSLRVEIYPKIDSDISFVIGDSNLIIGKLYVPSDSIRNLEGKSNETTILLRNVPRSEIPNTYFEYDRTRYSDILSAFPYADSEENSTLSFEYSVLSSVINISFIDNNYKIYNPVLLTLLYDFPEKFDKSNTSRNSSDLFSFKNLNKTEDVCLGKLNESFYWKCVNSSSKTESLSELQLQGRISEPGIYAVILSPVTNIAPLTIKENVLIEQRRGIIIFILIFLIIIGGGIYTFMRVYRYRGKYKTTVEHFKNLELEMNNLQERSTDIIGQTIGDTREGVIFTDNPAYKMKNEFGQNQRTVQLERLYDNYTKRLKTLERNNKKLSDNLENIKNEYERLAKVKEEMKNLKNNDDNI